MRLRTTLACLAFASALVATPLAAQGVSEEIVDATLGSWLIASADGSQGCRIRLEKDQTIGGRVVTEETPCAGPWHDRIAAWEFSEGGIVLRDATRAEIAMFEEQEGGPWRTPLEVSPAIYFIPDAGDMDHVPTEKEIEGEWSLRTTKGKQVCGLSFLGTEAAGYDGAKALELSTDCAASVRKTGASAWQISEIQLVVIGGEDWVFTLLPDGHGGFISDDRKFAMTRRKN